MHEVHAAPPTSAVACQPFTQSPAKPSERWALPTPSRQSPLSYRPHARTCTQGDTPPELVNRWGCNTLDHYLALYQSPEAPAAGWEGGGKCTMGELPGSSRARH